jgi:alkyl hydroperoxide reductase subunit AhpC
VTLRLGDLAPDFTADTTHGRIRFHEWKGDAWAVLFAHPRDFTPVCTTELASVARLKPEFDRRNARILGLSVDPVATHVAWERDIAEVGKQEVNFPLIGDSERAVARLYGMIRPEDAETATVRSLFVIGPDHRVKLMITYPQSTGRNFLEVLRAIDSLQLTANYSVSTPADWKQGDDVIILPSISDADARKKFPRGWKASKPYLRVTPQPDLV